MPGAVASIFIITMLLAYTSYRAYVLFTKADPQISKSSFMMDLNQEGPFNPTEYGFDLAFGIKEPLPAKYGRYQVRTGHFYYLDEVD